MRVYISQPWHGLTQEEIERRRNKVEETLLAYGHTIAPVVKTDEPLKDRLDSLFRLGVGIMTLSSCDAIYMMAGWEDARACRLEHAAAEEYGIQRLYEENGDLIDRRGA